MELKKIMHKNKGSILMMQDDAIKSVPQNSQWLEE